MGKDSIKISPKYGLNPALTTCFWCGKDTGVALMGRITGGKKGGDIEAPRYVFGGYEPCDECKENMALGVTLMEAKTTPYFPNQPEIQEGIYPTARFVVITEEAARRIFNLDRKRAFLDSELFSHLLEQMEDDGQAETDAGTE